MNYYRYSEGEIKQILGQLVILCDTREQKNHHIIEAFDRMGVAHISRKLDIGDYSAMLPAIPEMGIVRPLYFDRSLAVERKGSLNELSGNLTKDRERLRGEFSRAKGMRLHLLIEGASYGDILAHRYDTKLGEKAFFASLLSFQQRYHLNVSFIEKENAGAFIYLLLYYHVRDILTGQQ